MEGGVEAGDGRHSGQGALDERLCLERRRLMQRCKVGERGQILEDAGVEAHRRLVAGAAVDDAVPDSIRCRQVAQDRCERSLVDASAECGQVVLSEQRVITVE